MSKGRVYKRRVPKKIDKLKNPRQPDQEMRELVLRKLRAAKKNDEALSLADFAADFKIPEVGRGGLLTAAAILLTHTWALDELVKEGIVESQHDDVEGMIYYWLAD